MVSSNLHFKSWPQGLPHTLQASSQTLYENLVFTSLKFPDRKALIYNGTSLTYESLFEQVRIIGTFLAGVETINPGDRVLLYMQNSPQFIISYYAILGANCVIVPVNPMLQPAEVEHIILDSGAKFVITAAELLDKVIQSVSQRKASNIKILVTTHPDSLRKKFNVKLQSGTKEKKAKFQEVNLYHWNTILKQSGSELRHVRELSDLAIIPYTSGTTGKPKGCEHTYQTVNAVVQAYSKWLPLPDGAKILTTLPLFHVTGMQNSMNVPIFRGDTIILMSRWDVNKALYLIKEHRIQSWRSITTSIIDLISVFDSEIHDLSSLVSIGGGGAPMPVTAAKKLKTIASLNYIEAYGMTETMAPTHINPPNKPKLGSIGIPIFNVDARIIDVDSDEQLGAHAVGELVVAGPQVFLGYWNHSPATESTFLYIEGKKFLKTGDLGYFDLEGYFYIVDRLKRMISYSGFKVWPAEIESILYDHPDIKEVCIIGVADKRTGEKVKAVIVLRDNIDELDLITLKAWCGVRMAKYKIPKIFEIRAELPKNRIGKILWRQVS